MANRDRHRARPRPWLPRSPRALGAPRLDLLPRQARPRHPLQAVDRRRALGRPAAGAPGGGLQRLSWGAREGAVGELVSLTRFSRSPGWSCGSTSPRPSRALPTARSRAPTSSRRFIFRAQSSPSPLCSPRPWTSCSRSSSSSGRSWSTGCRSRPSSCSCPCWFPVALGIALGAGLWLSALHVKYRDVNILVPFLIQVGLFITPVDLLVRPRARQSQASLCDQPARRASRDIPLDAIPGDRVPRSDHADPACRGNYLACLGGALLSPLGTEFRRRDLDVERSGHPRGGRRQALPARNDLRRCRAPLGAARERASPSFPAGQRRAESGEFWALRERLAGRRARAGRRSDRQERCRQEHAAEAPVPDHAPHGGADRAARPRRHLARGRHRVSRRTHGPGQHLPQRNDPRHAPSRDRAPVTRISSSSQVSPASSTHR